MKEKFDDKELDQLFRDKFSGEETPPREIVWTQISRKLGESDRRPGAWIWWLSGIVLVLGIGTWYGISAYQKKSLSENPKVTGWNYNDHTTSFQKIPYESNGGDTGLIIIEGGAFKMGNADSADVKNNSDKIPASENTANTKQKSDQQSTDKSNRTIHREPNFDPLHKFQHVTHPNRNQVTQTHSTNDGMFNPSPGNSPETKNPETTDSIPSETFTSNQNITPFAQHQLDSIAKALYRPSVPSPADSVSPQKQNDPVVKTDSLKLPAPDSVITGKLPDQIDPDISAQTAFPKYFAALHGALDEGKILQSKVNDNYYNTTDVAVYDETKLKNYPQQTYSFGARFGWFLNKRISLTGGAYYSIFQSSSNEGHFKFNHNDALTFSMHSATSSVQCPSSKFDVNDCYHMNFDTCYIAIQSQERYDYVNFQFGISAYAVRTKHFGLYGNLLSNGALLTKQEMTLTVPLSGKTIAYSGSQLTGMNKFVMGGQTGIGLEYLPFGNLGLWAEPSFYFSGSLNKKNAVNLQPGGMRYLFGLTYHF